MADERKFKKTIEIISDIDGFVPSVSECFEMARMEFALAELSDNEATKEAHLSKRDYYIYMAAMPVFRNASDAGAAIDWMLSDLMDESSNGDQAPHNLPLYVRFLTQLRDRITYADVCA